LIRNKEKRERERDTKKRGGGSSEKGCAVGLPVLPPSLLAGAQWERRGGRGKKKSKRKKKEREKRAKAKLGGPE